MYESEWESWRWTVSKHPLRVVPLVVGVAFGAMAIVGLITAAGGLDDGAVATTNGSTVDDVAALTGLSLLLVLAVGGVAVTLRSLWPQVAAESESEDAD